MYKLIHGTVTDNNDPDKIGRIKFKSTEFLNGEEHPNWVDASIPSGGKGWGIYFPPEIGQEVYIIVPMDNPDTPVYLATQPTKIDNTPDEIKDGYPNKAVVKWYDMGYILFDAVEKKITISCEGDIDILSKGKVEVEAVNCVTIDAPLAKTTRNFQVGQAASGVFFTADQKIVTVNNGIVTCISD